MENWHKKSLPFGVRRWEQLCEKLKRFGVSLRQIPLRMLARPGLVDEVKINWEHAGGKLHTPALPMAENRVEMSGALEATYTIRSVAAADSGTYSVAVTNAVGTTFSNGAVMKVVNGNPGRFANDSTLGSGGFTMGFVVNGDTPKTVLVRGVGPGLRTFGVTNPASSVTLTINSGPSRIRANTGWSTASNAAQIVAFAGAFPLGAGSADSAILIRLNPSSYTVQVTAT